MSKQPYGKDRIDLTDTFEMARGLLLNLHDIEYGFEKLMHELGTIGSFTEYFEDSDYFLA